MLADVSSCSLRTVTYITIVKGYSIMPRDLKFAMLVSVIGFILLIIGSLGYMKVYSLDQTICYVLMGIGIAGVIGSLIAVNVVFVRRDKAIGGIENGNSGEGKEPL